MFTQYWRPVVIGLVAGIVGMVVVLASAEVWRDHWSIHQSAAKIQQLEASQAQVVSWINAVQQSSKQGK